MNTQLAFVPSFITPALTNDPVAPQPATTDADLSRLIVAAVAGEKLALDVLTPAIRTIARASLVDLDDAERLTQFVRDLFAGGELRAPAPSHATTFLDSVVRYYADRVFELTAEASWEQGEGHAARARRHARPHPPTPSPTKRVRGGGRPRRGDGSASAPYYSPSSALRGRGGRGVRARQQPPDRVPKKVEKVCPSHSFAPYPPGAPTAPRHAASPAATPLPPPSPASRST